MIQSNNFGDHFVYKYDTEKYKFIDYIKNLYNESNLT